MPPPVRGQSGSGKRRRHLVLDAQGSRLARAARHRDQGLDRRGDRGHVGKLGNPVLYVEGDGLRLWYVSVGFGGWAASSINRSLSRDGGVSWSPAEKLVTTPFLNISTLARSPPLALADGGLGLPVYHEFIAKRAEWLRLSAQGEIVGKVRMPSRHPALQPAVVALDGRRALALLRERGGGRGRGDGRRQRRRRRLAGGAFLAIANPDASVAVLRLTSGRLLLAANPVSGRRRYRLELFVSDDEGKTWTSARVIENDPRVRPISLIRRCCRRATAASTSLTPINIRASSTPFLGSLAERRRAVTAAALYGEFAVALLVGAAVSLLPLPRRGLMGLLAVAATARRPRPCFTAS